MIILDATNKSLEVVLAGTVATSQPTFVVSYAEHTSVSFTPKNDVGSTNNSTPVTLVSAPAASTQRQIKYLNVFNIDTADVTVTIQYNNNGTIRTLTKITIEPGEQLVYDEYIGFRKQGILGQGRGYQSIEPITEDFFPFTSFSPPNSGNIALTSQTAYAMYLGRCRKAYTHAFIAFSVATGSAASPTYTELAIATGTFTFGSNPSLTVRGYVDSGSRQNSAVLLSYPLDLSGVSAGDDLWAVFGYQGSSLQMRTMNGIAGEVAPGTFASVASTRPSTMSANTSFTINTAAPLWCEAWLR